jgi:hypothetical protein
LGILRQYNVSWCPEERKIAHIHRTMDDEMEFSDEVLPIKRLFFYPVDSVAIQVHFILKYKRVFERLTIFLFLEAGSVLSFAV